jgi:hypothetical protein
MHNTLGKMNSIQRDAVYPRLSLDASLVRRALFLSIAKKLLYTVVGGAR